MRTQPEGGQRCGTLISDFQPRGRGTIDACGPSPQLRCSVTVGALLRRTGPGFGEVVPLTSHWAGPEARTVRPPDHSTRSLDRASLSEALAFWGPGRRAGGECRRPGPPPALPCAQLSGPSPPPSGLRVLSPTGPHSAPAWGPSGMGPLHKCSNSPQEDTLQVSRPAGQTSTKSVGTEKDVSLGPCTHSQEEQGWPGEESGLGASRSRGTPPHS